MRLRIAEPEIDKKEPFLNDKLNREPNAIILTELFGRIEGPFAVSLNSAGGTGKTTFIKMLRQHLLNCGFPAFYFNAWDTDYTDNPLITFIGEISSGIDELKEHGFDIKRGKKVFIKIKKTGKNILKKTIPVTVKIANHGAMDIEKGMDDAFSDFTAGVIEDQIKNYSSTKEQVKKFKEQMKELITELQHSENNKPKPLIFFIDELDRCRPDYAVQLLEKIRHFFDIDGIITVLGIDSEQLGNSVRSIFGQNIKERGYLRKFIDLEYQLNADDSIIESYCSYLSAESYAADIIRKHPDHENFTNELFYSSFIMASAFSMSLRDLNILFNSLFLVFLGYADLRVEAVSLSVILLSLKMRNIKLFNQILNRERSVFYVINEFHKMKKINSTFKEYDKYFIEKRLMALTLKNISDDEYHHQLQTASNSNNTELVKIYKTVKENNGRENSELLTDELFNKIKLIDPLVFPG